jgi:hypothetical protein
MLEKNLMYLQDNLNNKDDKVFGLGYNICALCIINLICMR